MLGGISGLVGRGPVHRLLWPRPQVGEPSTPLRPEQPWSWGGQVARSLSLGRPRVLRSPSRAGLSPASFGLPEVAAVPPHPHAQRCRLGALET